MGFFQDIKERKIREESKQEVKEQMNFTAKQNRENISLQDDDNYHKVQQDRSDLIRWQQEFKPDINLLRYNFLGQYYNSDGQKISDNKIEPICNELFFDQIVEPTVSFYLNRSFTNSFLTEKKINDLLKRSFNNLATTLVKKHKLYQVKYNNFDDIIREMKTMIVPAAFRAINGSTKKIDSTMIKRIESHEDKQEPQSKRGYFGLGG